MPTHEADGEPAGDGVRPVAERGDDAGQNEDLLDPVVEPHDPDVAAERGRPLIWSGPSSAPDPPVARWSACSCGLQLVSDVGEGRDVGRLRRDGRRAQAWRADLRSSTVSTPYADRTSSAGRTGTE